MAVPFDARITPLSALNTDIVSGQISPEQEAAVVNELLRPGDLIYGARKVTEEVWFSMISEGIKRPHDVGIIGYPYSLNICFAMLPSLAEGLMRYRFQADHRATHHGPIDERIPDPVWLSLIVSRDRLHRYHPSSLRGVGESFRDPSLRDHFSYDRETEEVFGIPIVEQNDDHGLPPYVSEVRLFPTIDGVVEPVGQFYWRGIITQSWDEDKLFQWTNSAGISLPIPIINTEGKVLATSIS